LRFQDFSQVPVLLATSFFVFWAKFQNMDSGSVTDHQGCYRRKKTRQIAQLGDPNPMEDFPDQDSAKNLATNKSSMIFLLARAILGSCFANLGQHPTL